MREKIDEVESLGVVLLCAVNVLPRNEKNNQIFLFLEGAPQSLSDDR